MPRGTLFEVVLLLLSILKGIRTYYDPKEQDLCRNMLSIMREETDDAPPIYTQITPEASEVATVDETWDDHHYSVPWPGNKYHIFLDGTDQVICSHSDGKLHICDANEDNLRLHTWMCVEKDGYFGFFNTQTDKFMGHHNDGRIRSTSTHHNAWELVTIRHHPEGGYELLMPYWWHILKKVRVFDGSRTLVLERYGTTRWQFVKVE